MWMVHDNVIFSYEVDLQNDQITIHTKYDDSRLVEETDIVFTDVFNHSFEQQLKGSIILDIIESNIEQFIKDNSELLEKNKKYCWPMIFESIDEIEKTIIEGRYKYIILMSSYGMNGWVLAKNFEIITRKIKE
ncbi:hypothetical protein [Paenibacillus apiarius]|uniref:Uncharacterized protein n=1 Tax=Paenibacillus apiarius TaxID=46240 RepID=A0ABT4E4J3_9BACL|nr:hypothetical protein [Paenibacillus apiarius]MCY9516197.1 hypothetical protein [Paenibacillus apiarius]MCY9523428.1 hypothetical protein [Paenibacillus apiarius]MCY9555570.1 hypothetical protein [Paenibacillus apiarius]MCY9561558.1 hypothetical protein [Paenibacillus apiarius]MCY9687163.1 hypothetical protein [Paenibacillus apiarius]